MVKLEVLECPDQDYLGEYEFNKNLVYIGSNMDADLLLNDKNLRANHIFIEIVDDQLLAHAARDGSEFLVNGKITTKFKFLSPGSVIKVGASALKIVSFAKSEHTSVREILNRNTDELIQEQSPLLEYIRVLRRQL